MKRIAAILVLVCGLGRTVTAGEALFTNVYVVPPHFQTTEIPSSKTDGQRSSEKPSERDARLNARSAKEILESAGITFTEGASAIYDAKSSKVIVRNTVDQMKLVEAYMEWIRKL